MVIPSPQQKCLSVINLDSTYFLVRQSPLGSKTEILGVPVPSAPTLKTQSTKYFEKIEDPQKIGG